MKRRIVSLLLMCIIIFGILSNNASAAITISEKSKTMYIGGTYNLKITGTNKKVIWKSSNNKVATVSSNGKIIARNKGKVNITGKVFGKSYTCKIVVESDYKTICYNAYDLIVSKIWNEGFCDISHYIGDGKNSLGKKMDINKTIKSIGDTLEQIEAYDNFFNNLPSKKYSKIKKEWNGLKKETFRLYNKLKKEKPKASDKSYDFSVDKFEKYMNGFMKIVYS